MPRTFRPSPNELERLLREEKEKRKRMRIVQVRELSRLHALRMRNSYKSEMNRQINKLVTECRTGLLEDKENKLRHKREEYDKCLEQRGEGHDLAKEWTDPQWEKMAVQEETEIRAAERYRLALDELREQRAEAEAEATEAIRARQAALEMERTRSKYIAALPPPKPAPYEAAINGMQGRPVTVCDRSAMNTTHIRTVPDHYAVEAVDPDSEAACGPDARAKAVFEEERLSALRQRTVVSLEENIVKAHMRGQEAIRRELVHQDYNALITELNGLARGDLARRQRDFQRLPSRLFAVPHRLGHEARQSERMRERGFETAFVEQLASQGSREAPGDDDDDDSAGLPRASIQPTSPTKVRPSRRRKPPARSVQDDDFNGVDGDNRRFSGPEHEPSERPPKPRPSVHFQPETKEQTLQRLYQRIRSQRDRWLEGDEPQETLKAHRPPSTAVPIPDYRRPTSPSPFEGISSGTEEEEEEETETEKEEEVRDSVESQEQKRAPGQRPMMADLAAVSRIRTDVASKLRSQEGRPQKEIAERERVVEETLAQGVSDRLLLESEMRELDRQMEALRQRGRSVMACDATSKLEEKTHSFPKEQRTSDSPGRKTAQSDPVVIPSGLPISCDASVSDRSEASSLADVRAYQQRALARLASLTSDASERDDNSIATSLSPSVRATAKNIESRLHKVEMDLENERRKQMWLRQFLQQRAQEGAIEALEDPIVEPRRSQTLRSDIAYTHPYVSRDTVTSAYPDSANIFAESRKKSPPVRLVPTTQEIFRGDSQTPYLSTTSETFGPRRGVPQDLMRSDSNNPFLSSSAEPEHTTSGNAAESTLGRSDSKNPFLAFGSSRTTQFETPAVPVDSRNPFLTSSSNGAQRATSDFSTPFVSCSSTEIRRQASDLPLDSVLKEDSRNPFLSTASTDANRPTSELSTGAVPATRSDSRNPFAVKTTSDEAVGDHELLAVDEIAPQSANDHIVSDPKLKKEPPKKDEDPLLFGVYTDHTHPPTSMDLEQMVEAALRRSGQGDVGSILKASPLQSSAPEVVIEPGELSFETLPSNFSTATSADEKKLQSDIVSESDPEQTPIGSPDHPDAFSEPSTPIGLHLLPSGLPLRLRTRPPPVHGMELSRITEVDSSVSLSGATSLDQSEELKKTEKDPEEARTAFLRNYLLSRKEKIPMVTSQSVPESFDPENSSSEPGSLSQHTAAESDLSSSQGPERTHSFKVLPTLEATEHMNTSDILELSNFSLETSNLHMPQQPCLTSTMTGEDAVELLQEWTEEKEESEPEVLAKKSETVTNTSATPNSEKGLAQLLTQSRRDITGKSGSSLTQEPEASAAATPSDVVSKGTFAGLSQLTMTQSDAVGSGRALGLTQITTSDAVSGKTASRLSQRTTTSLSSRGPQSLSQNPTSCFTSSEMLAPSSAPAASLTQAPTSNLTSGGLRSAGGSNDETRALTQVSTVVDSAVVPPSLEQEPSGGGDEQCSLTQYPVSSFLDLSQPLSQIHDLEDSKEKKDTGGHCSDDTLQALDFSLPSMEMMPSKSEKPSQAVEVLLPVLSEASVSSAPSSRTPTSVDLLIARSRQLRQDNNSSLLRDDLLGQPDSSLVSSSTHEERPLTQMETKRLSEGDSELEQLKADSDSLVSFMRHEQELCRDSLSTRGSSESGGLSLQTAFAAHKALVAQRRPEGATGAKMGLGARKTKEEGSLEEMQKTLASWKAERLQRRVSGKALTRPKTSPPVSSASSSGTGSADCVAPSSRSTDEDASARTLRLWHQLEEVRTRAREEATQKEREQNRQRGREFSERMRARQRQKKVTKNDAARP